MATAKTSSFPSYKLHPYYQGIRRERLFYANPKVELWNKVLHIIIWFIRVKGDAYMANSGIMRHLEKNYGVKVSLGGVKQAFQKLIYDGYISCEYHVNCERRRLKNGRVITLLPKVVDHLRIYSTEDQAYLEMPKRHEIDDKAKNAHKSSRGRRLIRKKMYTVVDYVNMKKQAISEQYTAYTKSQLDYFNPRTAAEPMTAETYAASEEQRMSLIEDIYMDIDVGGYKN